MAYILNLSKILQTINSPFILVRDFKFKLRISHISFSINLDLFL